MKAPRISVAAFLTLLAVAFIMGANHVLARQAFNDGVSVATALSARSGATALVVAVLLLIQRVPVRLNARQRRIMPVIGLLFGIQGLGLYAAVARLPVALALLAFNTFPLWIAFWSWALYRRRPERAVIIAMPFLLLGLTLALDVLGASSGLGAAGQWSRIGAGVGFAMLASSVFGAGLVLTQHEMADLDGRVRTVLTMGLVALIALGAVALQGGFQLPRSDAGWWGLGLLTLCYGIGISVLLTLLPRLGVAGSSPILNIEPVFALVLAWLLLGQSISPIQIAGCLLVVGAVMALGLRKS
ncbi:MAG: DMT family transporter [Burkholderiaceae bacterium]|nr:DMT family transporter [Burkholderiaceae bacterium]MDO9089441.1 DMT family transporter [Burkholderiaceae bacterium]MDP1969018.1 DMT family transporter [Burkholderiaceae bacterium]